LKFVFIDIILLIVARMGVYHSANPLKRKLLRVINLSPRHVSLKEGEDSISTDFLTSTLYWCELSVSISGRLTTSSL